MNEEIEFRHDSVKFHAKADSLGAVVTVSMVDWEGKVQHASRFIMPRKIIDELYGMAFPEVSR